MTTAKSSTEPKKKKYVQKQSTAFQRALIFAFSFFALLSPLSAKADIPTTVGYQGLLKNASGTVISGSIDFTFRIYATSTGGAALWTETQTGITVTNGSFAVRLGSVTPFPTSVDFNQPLFISTEVGSDGEMSPRLTINSVPYAYTAAGVNALPSAPVSATGGRMFYNTADGSLQYYDAISAAWQTMGVSTGTFQSLTNNGNVTTNAIQFAGGTSTGDFVFSGGVTSTSLYATSASFANFSASTINSGVLGNAGVTLDLSGFGQVTGSVTGDHATLLTTLATPFTLQQALDFYNSNDILDGGLITAGTSGTIDVTGGSGFIRVNATDNGSNSILTSWATTTGLAVTPFNTWLHVYVYYNGGSPIVIVTPTDYSTNYQYTRLGDVNNNGVGDEDISDRRILHRDTRGRLGSFFAANANHVVSSGCEPSATGTRQIFMSACTSWNGINEVDTTAFDASGLIAVSYRDGVGGYIDIDGQTQWDNQNFDDGSGVLAPIGPGEFGVFWVYMHEDGTTSREIHLIYGRSSYATVAEAEAETPPTTFPHEFNNGKHVFLISKLVFSVGAGSPTEFVDYRPLLVNLGSGTAGTGGGGTAHNNLSGLQGGAPGEYYHLTASGFNAGGALAFSANSGGLFTLRNNASTDTKITIDNGGAGAASLDIIDGDLQLASTTRITNAGFGYLSGLDVAGDLTISGVTGVANLTFTVATGTSVTSTNLFATNAEATNLIASSSTLTNFTFTNTTGTNATSTNVYATNAGFANIVAGDVTVSGTTNLLNGVSFVDGTSTGWFSFANASGTRLLVGSSLLVGTTTQDTSSNYKQQIETNANTPSGLKIANYSSGTAAAAVMRFYTDQGLTGSVFAASSNFTTFANASSSFGIAAQGSAALRVSTNGGNMRFTTLASNPNPDMFIVGSGPLQGNIGIGTENPTSKFTVIGGMLASDILIINSTSTNATTSNMFVSVVARLPVDTQVNGQSVCLLDGTNCPSGTTPNFQTITNTGNTTTHSIQFFGGTSTGAFTVGSNLTVTGTTALQNLTFVNATGQYMDFSTGSNPAQVEGRLFYDNTKKALAYYSDSIVNPTHIGQETFLRVRNNSGSDLFRGQVVRVTGSDGGGVATVDLARADAVATIHAIGLLDQDIANGDTGNVIVEGTVDDLDTSTFSDGDAVYLSAATSGAYTSVRPLTPNITLEIGVITKVSATVGQVLVHFITPKFGAITPGAVTFGDTNNFITDDVNNLFWDTTFKRLGIGTSTPQAPLQVVGTILTDGIQWTTATGSVLTITGTTPSSFVNLTWTNVTGTHTTTTDLGVLTAARLPSNTLINNTSVCLLDGTNCPSGTTSNFQTVTNTGNTTTRDIQFNGGTSTGAFIVQNMLTVTGTAALQALTFTNATGSNIETANLALSGYVGTSLLPYADAVLALGSAGLRWEATFQNVTSTNVTTTNLFATNAQLTTATMTTGTITNAIVTSGTISTLSFAHGTSTSWFEFATATGTTVNASSGTINALASQTLVISGSATSTNFFATNGLFTNTIITGVSSLSGLTWTSATGTYATTTDLGVLTSARLPTNTLINDTSVCLSNGTNCPSGTTSNFQTVTNAGNTTTNAIQFFGGTSTGAFTVGSNLTVTGTTALQTLTFTNGTATSVTTTNIYATLANAATLFFTNGTSTSWFGFTTASGTTINASAGTIGELSVHGIVAVNATTTNTTSTNLFATNAAFTNLSVTNPVTFGGLIWTNATGTNTTSTNLSATLASITSLSFTNGTSTSWFGFTTASGTTLNAASAFANGLTWTSATGTYATSTYLYASTLRAGAARVEGTLTMAGASLQSVGAWTSSTIPATGIESIRSLQSYNGYLYAGQGDSSGDGDIQLCDPTGGGDTTLCDNAADWSTSLDNPTGVLRVRAMTEFNGNLYEGETSTTIARIRYCDPTQTGTATKCDSGDWQVATTTGATEIRSFATQNGFLYASYDAAVAGSASVLVCNPAGGGNAQICDTTADWTNVTLPVAGFEEAPALVVYLNRLYATVGNTSGDNDLFICDPTGGGNLESCDNAADWTRVINTGAGLNTYETASVYNGYLYFGTGNVAGTGGTLQRCDPAFTTNSVLCDATTDMTTVLATAGTFTRVSALQSYDGVLMVGREGTSLGDGKIYEYRESYATTTDAGFATFEATYAFAEYNGVLYAGRGNSAGHGQVWYYKRNRNVSDAIKFETSSSTGSLWFSQDSLNTAGAGSSGDLSAGAFKFSHGIITEAGAYDLAEMYPTAETGLQAGDVVAMSPTASGAVEHASGAYDPRAVGVVSTKPGFLLSSTQKEGVIPVALAGRVPVKFSNENGSVRIGDALTAASTTGYAMKATKSGVMIGRALQAFGFADASSTDAVATGTILMVVQTGYYMPTTGVSDIALLDANMSSGTTALQGAAGTPEVGLPTGSPISQGLGVVTLVARDATFTGNVTVLGPTSLRGPVILGSSNAGSVDVAPRTDRIDVQFPTPFPASPHVFVSFRVEDRTGGLGYDPALWDGGYFLTDVTSTGFSVRFSHGGYCPLLNPCPIALSMDWFTVGFESTTQTTTIATSSQLITPSITPTSTPEVVAPVLVEAPATTSDALPIETPATTTAAPDAASTAAPSTDAPVDTAVTTDTPPAPVVETPPPPLDAPPPVSSEPTPAPSDVSATPTQ